MGFCRLFFCKLEFEGLGVLKAKFWGSKWNLWVFKNKMYGVLTKFEGGYDEIYGVLRKFGGYKEIYGVLTKVGGFYDEMGF